MELSVIIVNYNVRFYLEQCLHSVQKACYNLKAEVIVVDNQSNDGSRNYLQNKFTGINFIWLDQNLGFAVANNKALQVANGKYILFLNPDTLIPEDCFEKCLNFFRTNDTVGALGVRMIDGAGNFLPESKRGFPTPYASFFKMSGLTYLFPKSKKISSYYLGHLSEKENHEVDVIAGAFMMIPKKVLEEVGSFDEQFFMYGEDVDLSYRIKKAGYKNYYLANATILHFKGESTIKSKQYIRRFYNAMMIYVRKHHNNFWTRNAMTLAIRSGCVLATIKNIFTENETSNYSKSIHAAVITSQPYLTSIIKLIQRAPNPLMIHGRVSAKLDDNDYAIAYIDDIPELVNKGITHFLLSTDVLTYDDIIRNVQNYRNCGSFLFHAHGSCSIIGSEDKNKRGITIALS